MTSRLLPFFVTILTLWTTNVVRRAIGSILLTSLEDCALANYLANKQLIYFYMCVRVCDPQSDLPINSFCTKIATSLFGANSTGAAFQSSRALCFLNAGHQTRRKLFICCQEVLFFGILKYERCRFAQKLILYHLMKRF